MFIIHKPEFCFEVRRDYERCVCGCSNVMSNHDDIDSGYCCDCAKKRKEFVDRVVGSIFIGSQKSYRYSMLSVIDNIRKDIFQERIYYMVDSYFCIHQTEKFQEPYDDDFFLEKIYQEKYNMMEVFISNIQISKTYSLFNMSNKIYEYYNCELNKMAKDDERILNEVTARMRGYEYIKKK